MRKGLLVMALVGALAVAAQANVYVTWQADAGFFFSATPGSGILGLGQSTIAQLIWSPDNVANAANANTANYVSGNDVWLMTITLTNNGGLYEDYALFGYQTHNDGGVLPNGGYVYARIFQDAAIGVDDWYYVGNIVAAADKDPVGPPADTPQEYNLNRDSVNGDAVNGQYGQQVVPEPASLSLLALGAVVIGVRRRRK